VAARHQNASALRQFDTSRTALEQRCSDHQLAEFERWGPIVKASGYKPQQ